MPVSQGDDHRDDRIEQQERLADQGTIQGQPVSAALPAIGATFQPKLGRAQEDAPLVAQPLPNRQRVVKTETRSQQREQR